MFPFSEARRGQIDFLRDVETTIERGGVLVAQVPTGLGKTAGVLAPALKAALERGLRVFFLTPKQSQHTVVVETLRAIGDVSGQKLVVSDLIAKQTMCPRPESERLGSSAFTEFCASGVKKGTCSYWEADEAPAVAALSGTIHHVGEAVSMCVRRGVCPHKALVATGQQAQVVVLDYNHFFSDMLEGTLEKFKLDLEDAVLVVDEAHNLPDRIRDHLTWRLSPGLLVDAARECRGRRGHAALAAVLESLSAEIDGLAREEKLLEPSELQGLVARLTRKAWPLDPPTPEAFRDLLVDVAASVEKEESGSAAGEVADFLSRFAEAPKGVLRATDPETRSIVYRILDAGHLARPILRGVRAAVLMSGTLYPMEMYAQILGVDGERLVTRFYENPFPPENRRVVVDSGVSTAYRDRSPATFDGIARRVSGIADATPGNVAAFFPSYDILDAVASRLDLPGRRIVSERRGMEKEERERLVGTLRRAGGRGLLLGVQGGSLSEGYDFVEGDENLIRSVIVVGVPYERPTLEAKAIEAFYEETFGAWKGRQYGMVAPAARRMLQAAGRGIRAPHHTAFIALLDERFGRAPLPRCYAPDFRYRVVKDVVAECRLFFGAPVA